MDDGQEGREEFRRQRSGERNGNGRGGREVGDIVAGLL